MNQQLPPQTEITIIQQLKQNIQETSKILNESNNNIEEALINKYLELSKQYLSVDMSTEAQQERIQKSNEIHKNIEIKVDYHLNQEEFKNKKQLFKQSTDTFNQLEQDLKNKKEIKESLQKIFTQHDQNQKEITDQLKKINEKIQKQDRDIDDMYKLYDTLAERLYNFKEEPKTIVKNNNLNKDTSFFSQRFSNVCSYLGIGINFIFLCYLWYQIHNQ